jgi:M6 family metalloprotease-like protein
VSARRSRRPPYRTTNVLLATAAVAVMAMAVPAAAPAYSPYGTQRVLVVFMKHPHPQCSMPTNGPACPRRTAADWAPILQTRLDAYYRDVSYGHTQIDVRVLSDPDTVDGWWPTPHTDREYQANPSLFYGGAALVQDAAENVAATALRRGLIRYEDLATYTRLLVIDNFRAHQGQAAGATPLRYQVAPSLWWSPTGAADAEGADDDMALSILEHELGHELGLPDLYSQSRCPLMEPGAFINPASTGDNADCVGPWDHMALDYWGTPGLGAFTRQLLGYPAGPHRRTVRRV